MGQAETTGCCFVHGGVTPGKQGISREFQVMFLDTDSRCDDSRTHRGTGDQLSTSSPTSLHPGFPLSLFHSLKNAPSLCRVIIWRGLIFYAERAKPSRSLSEVNCCYGCICLLNIMMVLWGVMPLWLSFLKTKTQPKWCLLETWSCGFQGWHPHPTLGLAKENCILVWCC